MTLLSKMKNSGRVAIQFRRANPGPDIENHERIEVIVLGVAQAHAAT
jgi:hypothetical protein